MVKIYSSLIVVLSLVVLYGNSPAWAASPRKWVQTFQSSEHKCPTRKSDYPKVSNEVTIPWEQLSENVFTAKIRLEDAEDLQRVFRRTFIVGHYESEMIFRGPGGKDVVEEVTSNLGAGLDLFFAMEYEHLFDLKWHDSVSITQTASRTYVVTWDYVEERAEDSPPIGTTFYVVKAGHLVPVCTFQPPRNESRRKSSNP